VKTHSSTNIDTGPTPPGSRMRVMAAVMAVEVEVEGIP